MDAHPDSPPLDLLFENGTILDGTGGPPRGGAVGVAKGRLHLGEPRPAARRLDVTGLVVAPGFIDIHAHTDFQPYVDPLGSSKAFDGVTLEVSGNCGFSAFPFDPDTLARERALLAPFGATIDWNDFTSYKQRIEAAGTGIHRALLVGHGNLRKAVVGYENREPTPVELERMKGLLAELLDQGAAGFSTGLIYPPGCYARTEEIIELAKVVASRDKLYTSHIRGEGDNLLKSIEEVLVTAVESGARTQISHLKAAGPKNWHKMDAAIEKIQAVRARGYRVMADRYPYTATNTYLDTCLRAWTYEGGPEAELRRLADGGTRERILKEMREDYPPEHFANIMIASVSTTAAKPFEGRTVADIAAERHADPYETLLRILEIGAGNVSAIFHTLNEEIMRRVLALDFVMVASDATAQTPHPPYIEGMPHPRSYGTFSRVLGPLSRDEGLLPLAVAVSKMTGMPALQLGLKQRGLVADGYCADLAVFDPAQMTDRATYREPHRYSSGLVHLVVNGQLIIEEGVWNGKRPGEIIAA
jgi:N-acyl-D-amino-acid deacylase